MGKILYITGTDTGVGKTYITQALTSSLRTHGMKAVAIKPVESGCERGEEGDLVPDDAIKLREASGNQLSLEEHCFYRLKNPLAPPLAAAIENVVLSFSDTAKRISQLAAHTELLIVEGAGGLLSPFLEEKSLADLICITGGAALVVVHSRLGAINHAALTLEALQGRDIPTICLVINEMEDEKGETSPTSRLVLETNREALAKVSERFKVKSYLNSELLSENKGMISPVCATIKGWLGD